MGGVGRVSGGAGCCLLGGKELKLGLGLGVGVKGWMVLINDPRDYYDNWGIYFISWMEGVVAGGARIGDGWSRERPGSGGGWWWWRGRGSGEGRGKLAGLLSGLTDRQASQIDICRGPLPQRGPAIDWFSFSLVPAVVAHYWLLVRVGIDERR